MDNQKLDAGMVLAQSIVAIIGKKAYRNNDDNKVLDLVENYLKERQVEVQTKRAEYGQVIDYLKGDIEELKF